MWSWKCELVLTVGLIEKQEITAGKGLTQRFSSVSSFYGHPVILLDTGITCSLKVSSPGMNVKFWSNSSDGKRLRNFGIDLKNGTSVFLFVYMNVFDSECKFFHLQICLVTVRKHSDCISFYMTCKTRLKVGRQGKIIFLDFVLISWNRLKFLTNHSCVTKAEHNSNQWAYVMLRSVWD
jgi:hypothetical protein